MRRKSSSRVVFERLARSVTGARVLSARPMIAARSAPNASISRATMNEGSESSIASSSSSLRFTFGSLSWTMRSNARGIRFTA
jgi:hypothetical protein